LVHHAAIHEEIRLRVWQMPTLYKHAPRDSTFSLRLGHSHGQAEPANYILLQELNKDWILSR